MPAISVPAAIFRKFCRPGSDPGVAADTPRVLQFGSNPTSVSPKIVVPENDPPDSLSYVEHIFANAGALELGADGHKFTAFQGADANVTFDGLRIGAGQLSGSGYKVSAGHYLEEGIVRLDSPFSRLVLGNHTPEGAGFSRGVLDVVNASGVGLVRLGQVTSSELFERINFPDVEIPIGAPLVPGSIQRYAYFHFYRRFDSGSAIHRANLTINTTTAAEITSTYGTPDEPGSDQWSNAGVTGQNAFVLWMRAGWDDSISGPLGNTPWMTPRIFDIEIYQPHGDFPFGWIDGGVPAVYWERIDFEQLVRIQGSRLQVKAVALDAPPNASFDGLWDALPWLECVPGEPTNLWDATEGYPRGRYLLLQLRFLPSPIVDLAGSTTLFYNSGSGVALRAYSSAAVPPVPGDDTPTPYEIRNSEGQALVAIPVTPQFAYDVTIQGGVTRFEVTDGSAITWPTVTRGRRVWNIGWPTLTGAQADELDAFFANRGGGVEPFTFDDPQGNTFSAAWVGNSLHFEKRAPNIWSLTGLTFVEVFDAA